MCGGTVHSKVRVERSSGLSPRVRGNQWQSYLKRASGRSIPACAGEPATPTVHPAGTTVYPRVCGGTMPPNRDEMIVIGLSPRVRGNPWTGSGVGTRFRSIPACAGEPKVAPLAISKRRVYPRVCGGTTDSRRVRVLTSGLSPRVRGNPIEILVSSISGRSIPACAGEPRVNSSRGCELEVYPRVCGGTL